ncbi:response regulator transcription factor [Niabella yanshanensis]|uniref:Response regulator transcription factor n=1 Tax=Niabella yanshanensis TaxID=577386 RepID=A0ABZ0WBI2_9BACT|nr:response regulator transcription factor [Niabella yanshanensis]WQD39994.1 response regulator transcription factor [Niabella yanshanensis]
MTTKLRCLLLDDEIPGLTYLKMLCEQLQDLEVAKAFNSPVYFLEEVPKLEFDFCILDIEMPEMNGLQVAALLKGKPVVFTTAYKEYAAEAFDLDAVDYVRKPVKKERLQQAVDKVKHRLESKNQGARFVQLNTEKGKALIYFDQLLYIKASGVDSRDKSALLADQSFVMLKNISFEKLQELLPKEGFVRVNKKEMISLKTVQTFSSDEITTKITAASGEPLKVVLSDAYRKEFIQRVNL